MQILITGGAGFIGSHLADELVNLNYDVILYDNLESQVHGETQNLPYYLNKDIKFIKADIRSVDSLNEAVKNVDAIIHLAARVGVAQSMYQVQNYVDTNVLGTAKLLDILINQNHDVKKLIVASSMSTYGEGAYRCDECGDFYPKLRKEINLKMKKWEFYCPKCNKIAKPIPTPETKPQDCTSIYALTKKEQEKMCLLIGEVYGINTTALRLFNVYGSRQALSNPYTGVCAIFSSNLLCGNPPIVYEDGNQMRDFIHVKDVVQAFVLSLKKSISQNKVYNVASANPLTIKEIANTLLSYINPNLLPIITNKYRLGDIRHCIADIEKIKSDLGFKPNYTFKEGCQELINWVKLKVTDVKDKSSIANKELKERGLLD